MKYLFLFVFFVMMGSICKAQKKPDVSSECKDCKCVIDKFYSKFTTIDKIKKSDEITSKSWMASHSLSDSSDIVEYQDKIMNMQNYYYKYNSTLKKVVLNRGKKIFGGQSKQNQQAFSFLKKKLDEVLTTGSTVYTIKAKTQSGKSITDYAVCNPNQNSNSKSNLTYDNVFFGLLFFKTSKTQ